VHRRDHVIQNALNRGEPRLNTNWTAATLTRFRLRRTQRYNGPGRINAGERLPSLLSCHSDGRRHSERIADINSQIGDIRKVSP